jgi:hypothetical protein
MPISGQGWELYVVREGVQRQASDGKRRTVGRYQVYHDGVAQTGTDLRGMTAESKGPGANRPHDNGKRVEPGQYPLWTHPPARYATFGYSTSQDPYAEPKPCLELKPTGERTDILVHPGHEFLASVGCINVCRSLPNAQEQIDYAPSRRRIISIITDLRNYLGQDFPNVNGKRIPRASVVIDGEP